MRTTGDTRPLLRPAEAAAQLAVSRRTVSRLIGRGDLRAVHVGRAVRIPPGQLDELIGKEGAR